jgi:hypothetical protein
VVRGRAQAIHPARAQRLPPSAGGAGVGGGRVWYEEEERGVICEGLLPGRSGGARVLGWCLKMLGSE